MGELGITVKMRGAPQPTVADPELVLAPAGETVSALKAVSIQNGQAFLCDATDPQFDGTCSGVSITGGNLGEAVQIRKFGSVDITGLSLGASGRVFVGAAGALVTAVDLDTFAFLQQIGRLESATSLSVDVEEAITNG